MDAYQASQEWGALSKATKKQRANVFRPLLVQFRDMPFEVINRKAIKASIDRRAATPFQAQIFLKAMRHWMRWAVADEHFRVDPTAELKAVVPKSDGFRVWSAEEIARFEQRWLIGTRERLAFEILRCTGLRRGDAARLGKQHIRNGDIVIKTEKTGTTVTLPLPQDLAAVIAATRTGDLALVVGTAGKPMVKEGFGNWFRDACNAAGVTGSAHGLRKAAAVRLAEAGATETQLNAIFGWDGSRMARHYTKAANTRKAARSGMALLERKEDSQARTYDQGAGENAEKDR